MRIRFGRHHFHRPHHFTGLGLIALGVLVVLWVVPAAIWVALFGAFFAFLGWQILRHHR